MFLSAIFLKRTGTTCKKHSWHASKMADDLSFQFTYSSMRRSNDSEGPGNEVAYSR